VEAAVTDNISVKLEYLYVRFEESHGIDPIGSIVLGTPVTWDRDNDAHVVRAGINFRFNLFAPPPAPAPVYTRG
ncbi:MAG TPA: hypothetical protein VHG30_11880, partial [Microvirga sp.]|nr:hypothetical protein [Microvirga sp.]